MFDKIRWLHISDLHLKSQAASWSQDVVLRALYKAITDHQTTRPVNFVLATGDLSYSGKQEEFVQVEDLFVTLLKQLGLSPAELFVVPGNHDNDLSVQKYSVAGARTIAISSGPADELIGDVIERDQILTRQRAYRAFVSKFIPSGLWEATPDGLGYVAMKTLQPLRISIVGLNSSWLCQSGRKDQNHLVVGERQIIEAIRIVQEQRPHIVIALMHHPLSWLCPFEETAIGNRLRQVCDFVLRGHLHETDVQTQVSGDRRCVFLAAGASFETRESRNSFNYVELDVGQGMCTFTPFDYVPSSGEFVEMPPQSIALAFRHLPKPEAAGLVTAVLQVAPELSAFAAYLACLLRGDKSEFLAFDDGRPVFLSLDALEQDGAPDLRSLTRSFMSLRNLCIFSPDQEGLRSTLTAYRGRLYGYGQRLLALADVHPAVRDALADRDMEAKAYILTQGSTAGHYTLSMLRDLRHADDLATLERIASRNLDDPHADVRREARRGLAVVHARSEVQAERAQAVSALIELCEAPQPEAEDFASLIQLLINLNHLSDAKDRIRTALKTFPEKIDGFIEIGISLVGLTGDRAFRDELLQGQTAQGTRS